MASNFLQFGQASSEIPLLYPLRQGQVPAEQLPVSSGMIRKPDVPFRPLRCFHASSSPFFLPALQGNVARPLGLARGFTTDEPESL